MRRPHFCDRSHLSLDEATRVGRFTGGADVYRPDPSRMVFVTDRGWGSLRTVLGWLALCCASSAIAWAFFGSPFLLANLLTKWGWVTLFACVFTIIVATAIPLVVIAALRGGVLDFDGSRQAVLLPCAVFNAGRALASFEDMDYIDVENWDSGRQYNLAIRLRNHSIFGDYRTFVILTNGSQKDVQLVAGQLSEVVKTTVVESVHRTPPPDYSTA